MTHENKFLCKLFSNGTSSFYEVDFISPFYVLGFCGLSVMVVVD